MALPLIPLLVAGVVVAVAALKGKGTPATATPGKGKGLILATDDTGPGGITRLQADGVAPKGVNGIRVFVDEAKVALFKSLADVGAALDATVLATDVYRLTTGADNRAQDVAVFGNQTQGRYLLMPIANAVGGSVPFMRMATGLPAKNDDMGGLGAAMDGTDLDGKPTIAAYAIVALPGETAALRVKAGIPGGGEAVPPVPAPPTPLPGTLPPLPGPDVLGLAPGALLPGDPYGVLAALGATPGLDALGVAGNKIKRQIANATDPQAMRDLANTYDAAGNHAVAVELRTAAGIVQALHDATAKAAEWAGIKALPSPYVGRGLNLVAPLDYSALLDPAKPICPNVQTVDLPAMIAAVWAGKPIPLNPDGTPYTDAQMLTWLLGLTRGDGSPAFPDGPIMASVPNDLCPSADDVAAFKDGLNAVGLVGPWTAELANLQSRLLPPIFGT